MSRNNKISISLRKKEDPISQEIVQAKKEQAASTNAKDSYDYWGESTQMHVHEMPHKGKKPSSPSFMKNIGLSIATALVISLALGFLLLRMFVSVTDEASPTSGAANADMKAVQSTPSATVPVDFPGLDKLIVQAGVFSSEAKANEWKADLTEQSLPSVIWERESQYYLLAGSGANQAEVELIAAELSAGDIPTYIKTWSVSAGNVEVSEAQSSVVNTIIQHLEGKSLADVPVKERKQLLKTWQETEHADGNFTNAIKKWANEGENGIVWLMFAKALEQMKK
ncbi:SPOR domain-containing protein [Halobacillus naozhouensis]|uniref:SPOR domain-containing protein n=1 Tax=Halobacillus naozhouensis TaxID=554880 RepID=A0ABY8ITM1_9BACI|nr:SPOR domain-containing protein [Halobacillus naozhouensis]WFT73394.1 SPOR domain-containing protein [Halobacillus naozhouensis]